MYSEIASKANMNINTLIHFILSKASKELANKAVDRKPLSLVAVLDYTV